MSEFRKVDANVAESQQGFTVSAGNGVEYVENGVVTKIDVEHAPHGVVVLYLRTRGPRALPDGARIYGNVARALDYLGWQPELWVNGEPSRELGLAPNSPETAPRDGRFIWCLFREDTLGETTYWAVSWDKVGGGWATRLGGFVGPSWRMEGWGPEVRPGA